MKKLFPFLFIVAACTPSKKENQEQTETAVVEPTSLTDAEKAEGWKLLFDGQTLNGWRIFKDRKNNTWEANDGTLHCKPLNENTSGDGDERSDIMTTDEFENFEFSCEWKISHEGNSGIIYRVTEEFEQPYYSGPEYQLIDDEGYKPKQKDVNLTGANYDMQAPIIKTVKPVGEWNSTKVIANGNHIEHWLNGNKILEYEIGSPEWQKQKENCKWKNAKGYGLAKKGHIDLQDHGHEVWFKNIMIKSL